MLIDTVRCTGCNACVIACQIENNIPVIGIEEMDKNRSMHWIRINTYLNVSNNSINGKFEPLMCQHCENAPCESVCPVGATSHSPEGLNEMTYNRCIGARYCMVNCPYEVRSFNFKDHTKEIKSPLQLILNKDVTVRSRGVAEKCTFCVQRLNEARSKGVDSISSVQTACQEACPMGAITFGNLLDNSSKLKQRIDYNSNRSYKLLESLNTLPAITYIGLNKIIE
jgi:molybdopterin-containing oxidoreductase family iron-sulfur binding subunit